MYCRNCGKQIEDKAIVCVHCGVAPMSEKKFCNNCGIETQPNQVVCTSCGVALVGTTEEKSKIVTGLFALLLGGFAAHKFYLGYTSEAIITLVIMWGGLILLGIPTVVMTFIVFIEGIIYLTKSDKEFQEIYVDNKKGWF